MEQEFDENVDFISLFKEVERVIPELSSKTKISKKGVTLLISPVEFYKKCTEAIVNSLQEVRFSLDCLPDNPLVDELEHSFSKIKNLLIAVTLSKKDLFQNL